MASRLWRMVHLYLQFRLAEQYDPPAIQSFTLSLSKTAVIILGIGVFQEYYMTGPLSEYSPSTIAWIPSLQVFFMMAMVRPSPLTELLLAVC